MTSRRWMSCENVQNVTLKMFAHQMRVARIIMLARQTRRGEAIREYRQKRHF